MKFTIKVNARHRNAAKLLQNQINNEQSSTSSFRQYTMHTRQANSLRVLQSQAKFVLLGGIFIATFRYVPIHIYFISFFQIFVRNSIPLTSTYFFILACEQSTYCNHGPLLQYLQSLEQSCRQLHATDGKSAPTNTLLTHTHTRSLSPNIIIYAVQNANVIFSICKSNNVFYIFYYRTSWVCVRVRVETTGVSTSVSSCLISMETIETDR